MINNYYNQKGDAELELLQSEEVATLVANATRPYVPAGDELASKFDWMDDARCIGLPINKLPTPGRGAVCATCPVRRQCVGFLAAGEQHDRETSRRPKKVAA